jgi:hypothetical protein
MRALLLAAALTTVASAASAQTAPSYEQRVREATEQIAHGDRATGMASLRTAITDAPTRAEAQCALAEGLRAGGDLQGALDGFQSCLRIARSANDQLSTARALHGVASTYERMPDHLNDARTAWMEYTHFADGAARVAPATIGRERVSAIDVAGEQERVYVDVRARIADRQRIAREAAAAPPPPPPTSRGRAHR